MRHRATSLRPAALSLCTLCTLHPLSLTQPDFKVAHTMDWRGEADAQARDVREGVVSIELDSERTTAHSALIMITTLVRACVAARSISPVIYACTLHADLLAMRHHPGQEGTKEDVELSLDGCRQVNDDVRDNPFFDSVHSLLLNTSAGYKRYFNDALKAKLCALVAEENQEQPR